MTLTEGGGRRDNGGGKDRRNSGGGWDRCKSGGGQSGTSIEVGRIAMAACVFTIVSSGVIGIDVIGKRFIMQRHVHIIHSCGHNDCQHL